MPITINGQVIESGDPVICYIQGRLITNAHIHVDTRPGQHGCAWICHDEYPFEGDRCPNRYGHRYSWSFSIRTDGSLTTDVTGLLKLGNDLQAKTNVVIDPEITRFLETNLISLFELSFKYKLGAFDDFNNYKMSTGDNSEGLIHLSSSEHPKKVEIKFSRFARQLILAGNAISFLKFDESDKFIEDLNNKYIAHQTGATLKLEFVSGKAIIEAYKKDSYAPGNNTLHKSCMTDKGEPGWLDLYVENPNHVELAVVYFGTKVAARAFVWKLADGRKFIDRVYYVNDWLDGYLTKRVEQEFGIKRLPTARIAVIQLDKWKFNKFPYLDSFCSFDKDTGQLYYAGFENLISLRNTNGGPQVQF